MWQFHLFFSMIHLFLCLLHPGFGCYCQFSFRTAQGKFRVCPEPDAAKHNQRHQSGHRKGGVEIALPDHLLQSMTPKRSIASHTLPGGASWNGAISSRAG
jgi:hypothetical protein